MDWFVDANGDYCRSPEVRVLGNQPNRRISWGPSSSEHLEDSNFIRGHPLSAYLHRHCFPNLRRQFWEVRPMVEVWGMNMKDNFIPGYMNCLDESMSVWMNKFTCPGFMFIPRKPWPFGNKYHTICCCSSGIMWDIDLVEGKDCPQQFGIQQYDNFGSTVGLLLRMLSQIYHKGFIVILDSGFVFSRASLS